MAQDSKKQSIINAAIKVMIEKGVAHSSLNDIIRASGVSKGGVYHYFPSKEDLLVGVLVDFQEQHLQHLAFFPEDEPSIYEKLKTLITGHNDLLEQMGQYTMLFLDLFSQAARIPKLKQAFYESYSQFHSMTAELVQQGIDNGEFKQDADALAFSSALIGIFDGIGAGYMVAPDIVDYPNHAVRSALYLLEGIKA